MMMDGDGDDEDDGGDVDGDDDDGDDDVDDDDEDDEREVGAKLADAIWRVYDFRREKAGLGV